MLKEAAFLVATNAEGAGGDMTREEQIDSAAESLSDFVYEGLQEYDFEDGTVINTDGRRVIEQLIAMAMLAQYKYDTDRYGDLIAFIEEEQHSAINK